MYKKKKKTLKNRLIKNRIIQTLIKNITKYKIQ